MPSASDIPAPDKKKSGITDGTEKRVPKTRKRSESTTPANRIIGENLRRIRESKRFTQVEVCDFAAINRSFYQRVEACTENVTIEYLEKLRPVLKCRWSDIFKGLD